MSAAEEFTGRTVEIATQEAEERFGKKRDQLEVEVLSQGSRGVFGLGGELARVSVTDPAVPSPVRESAAEAPALPRPSLRREAERPVPAPAPKAEPPAREPAKPRDSEQDEGPPVPAAELAVAARETVTEMLNKMGFDEVEVTLTSESDPIALEVSGENLGMLIGRRGESLAALQFMVNVILSKRFHSWPRCVIDIQAYRARRETSLTGLGQRVADRVRRNGRAFTLEAMPANDRRIIHMSLKDRADVETYSTGEGQSRRVVVAPKK